MTRLVKMLKLIKERNKLLRYLNEWLKLEAGIQRLFLTVLSFLVFCHIAACVWYMIGDINSDDPTNWIFRFSLLGASSFEVANFLGCNSYFFIGLYYSFLFHCPNICNCWLW